MATVVLSAAPADHPALATLAELLGRELRQRGENKLRVFDLTQIKLAYCQGEFDCWVKTPGVCRAHDAEAEIVQAVHDADRLILVGPVTFGGHGYAVKRAIDRLICLVSPFFDKRASLTHHEARYERLPAFYALGWMPRPDAGSERTWRELTDANALNLCAPRFGAAVVTDENRAEWGERAGALLDSEEIPGASIAGRGGLREALLMTTMGDGLAGPPPRTAALIVGSAKVQGTSVSENLARALQARLEAAGVATELHFAVEFLHAERAAATARALAAADLLVLVSPLYVDAWPALATQALESIAAARAASPAAGRFAAVVNCGFPEAEHNRTALRIARHFAAAAGYGWSGGLALGGGGTLNPRVPLDQQHGPAQHVITALDLAAPCLARGECVPREAIEQMASAPMPDALYRMAGDLGWRYQVWKNGLGQAALHARPLD